MVSKRARCGDLGLRDAGDRAIFDQAGPAAATLVTKDSDFVELVVRLGSPPQVVWVTCGNCTNEHLQAVFSKTFAAALQILEAGAPVVEIGDPGAMP